MKTVAIIAGGASKQDFVMTKKVDVWAWAFNVMELKLRKQDAVFELHNDIWDTYEHAWEQFYPPSKRIDHAGKYLKCLRETKAKVYMEYYDRTIPNCEEFPFEDILIKYGGYFDNSLAYMLAYAIEKGYKKILIYGVDFDTFEDRGKHSASLYMAGVAKGMGIEVVDMSYTFLVPMNGGAFQLYGVRKDIVDYYKEVLNDYKGAKYYDDKHNNYRKVHE